MRGVRPESWGSRAGLRLAVAVLLVAGLAPAASAQNTGEMLITFQRVDDPSGDDKPWYAEVSITELDLALNGATLQVGAGTPVPLTSDDPSEYQLEEEFDTFSELEGALSGDWVVTFDQVSGQDIITELTVDLSALDESDIYDAATITTPQDGAMDVPVDIIFQWDDPTSTPSPYALAVDSENDTVFEAEQEENSIEGPIAISATSWQPADPLSPGINYFAVSYFVTDESLVGTFDVTQGSFTWLPSQLNPPGYPANTPLIAHGSEAIVGFDVPLVEDFESYPVGDGTQKVVDDGGEMLTVQQINTLGGVPVASVVEGLTKATRVAAEPGSMLSWGLESGPGQTDPGGFVLIGDIPAINDAPTAGPFSDFFGADPASRTPRPLFGSTVSVRVRQAEVGVTSSFRLLMGDDGDNENATALQSLSNTFEDFSFHQSEFTEVLDMASVDFDRITYLAIEMFTTPGTVGGDLELRVDEIRVEFVPEPGAGALAASGLLALGALARHCSVRRRRGVPG